MHICDSHIAIQHCHELVLYRLIAALMNESTDVQDTTINQTRARRFDPRVFVNKWRNVVRGGYLYGYKVVTSQTCV